MTTTTRLTQMPPPRAGAVRRLLPLKEAARSARAWISAELREWRIAALLDEAALVASELAANGIRHGLAPVSMSLSRIRHPRGAPGVRIEMWDRGPGFDASEVREGWKHRDDGFAEGGRGLRLVDALAESWGNETRTGSHVVWACLYLPGME
ncbi:ATP-binding protein [Streptomyces sp. NPDC019396]|uniref:ATP-binding protein n=1 Tax=Streptomyces sp. NPDC019396 TaxID=3154687 RepID=UPI0033D3F760